MKSFFPLHELLEVVQTLHDGDLWMFVCGSKALVCRQLLKPDLVWVCCSLRTATLISEESDSQHIVTYAAGITTE